MRIDSEIGIFSRALESLPLLDRLHLVHCYRAFSEAPITKRIAESILEDGDAEGVLRTWMADGASDLAKAAAFVASTVNEGCVSLGAEAAQTLLNLHSVYEHQATIQQQMRYLPLAVTRSGFTGGSDALAAALQWKIDDPTVDRVPALFAVLSHSGPVSDSLEKGLQLIVEDDQIDPLVKSLAVLAIGHLRIENLREVLLEISLFDELSALCEASHWSLKRLDREDVDACGFVEALEQSQEIDVVRGWASRYGGPKMALPLHELSNESSNDLHTLQHSYAEIELGREAREVAIDEDFQFRSLSHLATAVCIHVCEEPFMSPERFGEVLSLLNPLRQGELVDKAARELIKSIRESIAASSFWKSEEAQCACIAVCKEFGALAAPLAQSMVRMAVESTPYIRSSAIATLGVLGVEGHRNLAELAKHKNGAIRDVALTTISGTQSFALYRRPIYRNAIIASDWSGSYVARSFLTESYPSDFMGRMQARLDVAVATGLSFGMRALKMLKRLNGSLQPHEI